MLAGDGFCGREAGEFVQARLWRGNVGLRWRRDTHDGGAQARLEARHLRFEQRGRQQEQAEIWCGVRALHASVDETALLVNDESLVVDEFLGC